MSRQPLPAGTSPIAQALSEFRTTNRLTLAQMSEQVGFDIGDLSHMIRDQKNLGLLVVKKLAIFFAWDDEEWGQAAMFEVKPRRGKK